MTDHSHSVVVSRERFSALLARTIVLMDQTVDRPQLQALAAASAVICWEFPDIEWRTWLVVDRARSKLRPNLPTAYSDPRYVLYRLRS